MRCDPDTDSTGSNDRWISDRLAASCPTILACLEANSVIIYDLTERCEDQIIASCDSSKALQNALKYEDSTTENKIWSLVIYSSKSCAKASYASQGFQLWKVSYLLVVL